MVKMSHTSTVPFTHFLDSVLYFLILVYANVWILKTNPRVNVTFLVTMLHQTDSSHSASFSDFISSTWMDYLNLIYQITPPPLLPIFSFLNIAYPVIPDSASDILMVAQDSLIPIM